VDAGGLNGRACDAANMVQSGVTVGVTEAVGVSAPGAERVYLCKARCHAELRAGKMHPRCLISHPPMEYSITIMFHLSLCEYNAALESQNSKHCDRDASQSFACPEVRQLQANRRRYDSSALL